MPLPKHIFNPPFNLVRTSHVVLGVADLDRSLEFYQATLGLHLEDRTSSEAYLRGVEERQHHSLVLKKSATPVCERLGYKLASEEDLDKAAAFLTAKHGDMSGQPSACSFNTSYTPSANWSMRR